ncbi:alpha/beta hydrolase family protein [Segniliparus rugosus]|nr:alpha/beta hydrolase family protein [Segniliparus rugosus]
MVGISVGNPDTASRVGVLVPDRLPRARGGLDFRRNVELAAVLRAATKAVLGPVDDAAVLVLQSDDLGPASMTLRKELRALPATSAREDQQVTLIGHGLGRKAVVEAVEGSPDKLADRVVLIQHLKNPRARPSRYEGTQWHHVQEPPGAGPYWCPDDTSLSAVAAIVAGSPLGT